MTSEQKKSKGKNKKINKLSKGIISQGDLLGGVLILHKAGLDKKDALIKQNNIILNI